MELETAEQASTTNNHSGLISEKIAIWESCTLFAWKAFKSTFLLKFFLERSGPEEEKNSPKRLILDQKRICATILRHIFLHNVENL